MNKDDIIRMAREAGFSEAWLTAGENPPHFEAPAVIIKRFADLVAKNVVEGMVVMTHENFKSVWDKAQSEEREACAKVCDDWYENRGLYGADALARAIRARGNQ